MTSFIEEQFPTDISYGAVGGPEYSTDIVETASGREQRNRNWSESRAKYNVAHGVKSEAQYAALIAFFRVVGGKAVGFRFKDWSDYRIAGGILGIGDGSATEFQITKEYSFGTFAIARDITKPVDNAAFKIYFNSIVQNSGYTVDFTTGIVTFTSAPADEVEISIDCEFDVPVRFDTDKLDINLSSYGVGTWDNIPIIEVRV